MLPGIDLRIANLIKAVQQIILPALPSEEKLAQEQARLVVGHLNIIQQQWKYAVRFEAGSLSAMTALAERIVDELSGAQREALEQALAGAKKADHADLNSIEQAIISLGSAIDAVILGDEGRMPLPQGVIDAVLDYGTRQSLRERVWFAGNGLDPDKAQLPELSEVIQD